MLMLSTGNYSGMTVARQDMPRSIVSTVRYSGADSNCDWHWHENLHISFVFQGGGESQKIGKITPECQDNIFFYRAGQKHRWIPGAGITKSINIELDGGFPDEFEHDDAQVEKALRCNRDAKFLMLKMQQELIAGDRESRQSIHVLLLELISYSKIYEGGHPPEWVGVVAEILNDRWNESVSLGDLSSATGVHPVTISKSFRKYFSCTLGEYLRKLKVEKSISLIKNSEKSLTEIAMICGFSDQSHFTRTFKRITNFLPRDFRRI